MSFLGRPGLFVWVTITGVGRATLDGCLSNSESVCKVVNPDEYDTYDVNVSSRRFLI